MGILGEEEHEPAPPNGYGDHGGRHHRIGGRARRDQQRGREPNRSGAVDQMGGDDGTAPVEQHRGASGNEADGLREDDPGDGCFTLDAHQLDLTDPERQELGAPPPGPHGLRSGEAEEEGHGDDCTKALEGEQHPGEGRRARRQDRHQADVQHRDAKTDDSHPALAPRRSPHGHEPATEERAHRPR